MCVFHAAGGASALPGRPAQSQEWRSEKLLETVSVGIVGVELQCRAIWVDRVWGYPRGQQLLDVPLGLMHLLGSFLEGAGLALSLRVLGRFLLSEPHVHALLEPVPSAWQECRVQSLFTLSRE